MSHNIPGEVLDNLRCSFCQEHLSVFPIYMYPDCQRPLITCGRCPTISDQNPIRNTPYETLASLYKYPCRYKPFGCLDSLLTDTLKTHEDECRFRQYFCPTMPLGTCPWQGPASELLSHFNEYHGTYLLDSKLTFEIDLINKYETNCIFEKEGNIFLLQTRSDYNEKLVQIYVRCIGAKATAEKYSFQATLTRLYNNENSSSSEKFPLPPAVVGNDSVMNIEPQLATKASVEDIMRRLNNPPLIICSIQLHPRDYYSETATLDESLLEERFDSISMVSANDERLLRKLECPACLEYMIPPIHQCLTGHSLCANCKTKISVCPICKVEIGTTRNFTLEDLAEEIMYPCKYSDFDCLFTAGHREIKKHEINCKFGPYECPVECCSWKGKLTSMMKHLADQHQDSIVEFGTIICYATDGSDSYFTSAFGRIFKIEYKSENDFLFITAQAVQSSEEQGKYSFEIDFVNDKQERTYFKRKCSAYCKEDCFESGKEFLKIPMELIRDCYIDDMSEVQFKILNE